MLLVVGRGTIRENKRLGYVRVFVLRSSSILEGKESTYLFTY